MTPARDPKQGLLLPLCRILVRGTGPRGLEMAVASLGVNSQDLATILDPFRTVFADLGPDRQMPAIETGQMSAAETGQICAVEARHILKSQIVGLALNHQKWPEMSPEWSPGPENRPP